MAQRQYDNDYPSVTQVLGVLRKPALENWFMVNTPEFCRRVSGLGKKIGTEIHTVIQSYIETGSAKIETDCPEQVANALKSFIKFKEESQYILKRAELALTHEKYFYNGTIDCVGDRLILDWKTGKCGEKEVPPIYDEYKYQVSAYVYLYNEAMQSNIKSALIVSIAKDKIAYNAYLMEQEEILECFYEVFIPALKIWKFQHKKKERKND